MGRDPDREALRAMMLRRRDATSHDMLQIASQSIRARLSRMEPLLGARGVGAYHSVGSEVRTDGIIRDILDRGQRLMLPAVRDGGMAFHRVSSASDLVRGAYDIMEPKPRCPRDTPDILVVPAVCVTPRGDRLGYGGGHYDGYLGARPAPAIALAMEKQVVRKIPPRDADVPVDWIVTESRTRRA